MANIIGEEFDEFVWRQINVRQKIHGSGTSQNPRTNEYLTYLNSKTAWVKLASGVKITPERLEKEGINAEGFYWNGLAKNRVLYGGVSRLNESNNQLIQRGTDPTKNNITDYYTGTYNVNQKQQSEDLEFGLVPMPGITDVSIKNKNRGSIKEATVKIKAYTRDQFDFLDLLYMRLGYTVFLEWGWSVYFDNDEEYKNMGYTLTEAKNGFFNDDWGKDENYGYTNFLNQIRGYRGAKNGNYDGLLAKVRNFEWTISEDGTYDITLSLISMGDVIESLKTNIPPSTPTANFLKKLQTATQTKEPDPNAVETLPVNNSVLAYLYLYKLTSQQDNPPFSDLTYKAGNFSYSLGRFLQLSNNIIAEVDERYQFFNDQEAKEKVAELEREFKADIDKGNIAINKFQIGGQTNTISLIPPTIIVGIKGKLSINNPFSETKSKDIFQLNYRDEEGEPTENGYYIRLGNLLEYINSKVIPIEKSTGKKIIKINTSQYGNFMFYHPLQFSHDPRVCIVKSFLIQPKNNIEILPQLPGWHEEGNDYAWTMNIYVNFTQVENSMNENLDEEGNLSLFNFLESLCTAINKAMGGVNNLEPVIDEDTNTINIIDGSYTPNQAPKKPYGLELYGYNPKYNSSNFVRNFSVKSTISKEYASMVSIGSTAGGYTKGTEATMFSKWNTGLIDRFKEKYEPGDPDSIAPSGSQDEAVTNYLENIVKIPTQGLGWWTNGKSSLGLDSEVIDSNLSIVTEFYKYCQTEIQNANPKYASPISGFIPINLNVNFDGISGMRIYNVVRVSTRFLPKNYSESLRFIIKSVDHKLSNNDWETSIDTVVIPENYDSKNKELILPYDKLYSEVVRILKEGLAKLPNNGGEGGGSSFGSQAGSLAGFRPSGYGETYGSCGAPKKEPITIITPNNKVNQNKAKKLIQRVVKLGEFNTKGLCAKGVKNLARKYWGYYNNSNLSISKLSNSYDIVSGLLPKGGSPQDAKSKNTHDSLIREFGYKRIRMGSNLSKNEVTSLARSIKPNIGDIMIYWDTSNKTGNHQKYGHIQMYIGNNRWHSDFEHSSFVYGNSYKGDCWELIYLAAPNIPIKIKN